ncbi:MAG TPA: UDP-2,3-diacylglucosamine diphosphatase [Rhizomicrobium sp.]|jgi:UDP-2,3-diacylglucosamine pyrophosphatase LpxH|nr:UDP-2,3-diacylglucosamine diphosphatase [Rhizomicrobium sp.]HEX4534694.1 UDP-2,3-diacylglucosamine diphosphatase [Rhizomicrobium sp.]
MADLDWAAQLAFLKAPDASAPRSRGSFRGAHHHRTIFVSDTHLGTRGCKADLLADFLAHNSCDTLFLVGDIVDGWRLKRRWHWPHAHTRVIHEILRMADCGTRVIYVPGNHDEAFRQFCGRAIDRVEIVHEAVHQTADGRRLLVLHGDRFDTVIACAKWLAHLGDWAYSKALDLNEVLSNARRMAGLPYWSLANYLKHKVKNALEYICRFEAAVAREAREHGYDGVVCGHIHQAAIKEIDGITYMNDGDWVESCTALVEDARGRMEILHWTAILAEPDASHETPRQRELPAPIAA